MSRKPRDTSQKREEILVAAMQTFSREGYAETSMDRIAEAAGASKRTVYNHFRTKEQLFQAVLMKFAAALHQLKLIDYDPAESLEEQLGRFVDAELALPKSPEWMGFLRVLLTLFLRDPSFARQTVMQYSKHESPLVCWLDAAVADNRLRIDDTSTAANLFQSMISGAFTWPAVYQGYHDAQASVVMKQEIITTFLCRYGIDTDDHRGGSV